LSSPKHASRQTHIQSPIRLSPRSENLADETTAPVQPAPKLLIVGVGGAGGNAINNMIRNNLTGVDFAVINTDAQALQGSQAGRVLDIGCGTTRGLGAGARPEIGRAAAEESYDELAELVAGANMIFITAGMGGGTGTGAAPVVARAAREAGVLTVGVVTKPFQFEGHRRMRIAEEGIAELRRNVDTLIVIANQNLFRVANERTTFAEAFRMADDVLLSAVRGVTDVMTVPGLVNVDFADVRAVMAETGRAIMGIGEGEGENRALDAAEAALANPLFDDVPIRRARGAIVKITGGSDLTLFEIDSVVSTIRDEVHPEANIIFGSTFDETLAGRLRLSVVATGIDVGPEDAERGTATADAQPSAPRERAAPPTVEAPASEATPLPAALPVLGAMPKLQADEAWAVRSSATYGMTPFAIPAYLDPPPAPKESKAQHIARRLVQACREAVFPGDGPAKR
jgi:cell division protein FtsZ